MTIPIRGTAKGTPDQAYARAIQRGAQRPAFLHAYLTALYADAATLGINADVLVAQWDLETDSGRSAYWLRDGNPAGIGAFTDGSDLGLKFTPETAARGHVTHMCAYLGISPPAAWIAAAPRWQAVVDNGWFGSVRTTADLGSGKWADDTDYPQKLRGRYTAYWGEQALTKDPAMPTYKTVIPGLPGGPLETSFPVVIKLIPASRTYQRPGLKLRGTPETTQHNTSNWGTMAADEARYLVDQMAGGRQASWHITIDDGVCYIHVPVDEVAWHAGDGAGPGNYSSVACELTMQRDMVNDTTRWRRARSNAAEILGKIAARKGADDDGEYHHKWSLKDCPILLRNNSTWTREYNADYSKFHAMERAAMAGTPTTPADDVINIGDTIQATVALNLRQQASTRAPIITTLEPGTKAHVNGRYESADGYGWLPVLSPAGEGFVAMGDANGAYLTKVASAPIPIPPPTYVERRPIPALLETDLQKYDTAEGITTDDSENEFIFVADVIEFTAETVAGEFAVPNPRAAKAPFKVGDRAIAAWLVKAKPDPAWKSDAHRWHYILTGGDDEWIRVPYLNTKRISDAPLLPDEEQDVA